MLVAGRTPPSISCLSATDPATLTASPQRVFKSRCYFCSSTNGSADPLPTAASITDQTLNIAQTADSKPPITAPTRPSRISSICSQQPDAATSLLNFIVGVVLFNILQDRILQTCNECVFGRFASQVSTATAVPVMLTFIVTLPYCGFRNVTEGTMTWAGSQRVSVL
jgi:hypothetical protein